MLNPGNTPSPMFSSNPQVIATALRDLIARITDLGMIEAADELTYALARIEAYARQGTVA